MRFLTLLLILFLTPGVSQGNMEEFLAELNKLSPAERHKKLVAGAKQEGEAMLYSSSGLEEVRAVTKHFSSKYPFVNARFMRKGGSQLFDVSQLEFKAQKRIVDVYWAGHSTLGPMLKLNKQMLARYLSPERAGFPEDFKDKEGYWTATRSSVAIFAHHSQRVPKDKVPTFTRTSWTRSGKGSSPSIPTRGVSRRSWRSAWDGRRQRTIIRSWVSRI